MPQIGVIVPVYKVEAYLKRCVDSILAQSFSDFELILVDDGSTDNCGVICNEYAKTDRRIHVIHQENAGLSAARNAGIDKAFLNDDIEWISFIDSDDWVHSRYLELLFKNALQFEKDISICGFVRTKGEVPFVDAINFTASEIDVAAFYIDDNVTATTAWGKLYKKELFKDIRYPSGRLHEDEFTTYKVLFQREKAVYINQPLYFYFQNPEGIMLSEWNPKRMDVYAAYQEQIEFFRDKPEIQKVQLKRFLTNMHYTASEIGKYEKLGPYKKTLQKMIKANLVKYRKLLPWKEIPTVSNQAFPLLMKCYWIISSKINKQ